MTEVQGAIAERLTRAQRKDLTRASLLTAARSVVARRGMQAATHQEIASEAGLTIGAIYSNFGSKADLMATLMDGIAMNSPVLLEERSSVQECLEALAHQLVRQVDEDPEAVDLSLEFVLFALRDSEARERRLPHREAEHQAHAAVFERIAAASQYALPVPPRDFAEAVSNLAWSLMVSRRVLGPAVITEERIANALTLLAPPRA